MQAQNFRTPIYTETDVTGGGLGLTTNARSATDTRGEFAEHSQTCAGTGTLRYRW